MSSARCRPISRHEVEESALDRMKNNGNVQFQRTRQAREKARQVRLEQIEKKIVEQETEKYMDATNGSDHDSAAEMTPQNSPHSSANLTACNSFLESTSSHANEASFEKDRIIKLEDKMEQLMMMYSQVENEKTALNFENDVLKDDCQDLQVLYRQSTKECRELTENVKVLEFTIEGLHSTIARLKNEVAQRDNLIKENGFMLVCPSIEEDGHDPEPGEPVLLSIEAAKGLERVVGPGELDAQVRKIVEQYRVMRKDVDELEQSLLSRRIKEAHQHEARDNTLYDDVTKEATRQLGEYKLKLQEAERQITAIQGQQIRTESQMNRHKLHLDTAEKELDESRRENRQLKKELREAKNALEEQKDTNQHLQSRLEKLRATRNLQ